MRKVPTGRQPTPYVSDWTIRQGLAEAPTLNLKPGAGMLFVADDGSEKKYPFAEVESEALRRGRWLLSTGLRKGDHVGFVIPDVFVVGYGIDYAENFRHLPFIGRLAPEGEV